MSTAARALPDRDGPETRARAVLAQRAVALARPAPVAPRVRLVGLVQFGIGGAQYAVEAEFVREVLRRAPLSRIPWAPAALVGVAAVRGEILPVADVSAILGVRAPESPGPVIVLEGPWPPLGLLVDGVHDLVEVPADSIAPVPREEGPTGGAPGSLLLGVVRGATVLSAGALSSDPRLSTTT